MMIKGEKPLSPDEIKETVLKYMSSTVTWGKRPNANDVDKINKVVCDLHVKVELHMEKSVYGLKYIYYMKPVIATDYKKLLSPAAQIAFSGVFGVSVRLYREGEYVALETPGGENLVHAADVLNNEDYYNSKNLKLVIGLSSKTEPVMLDLEDAPHLLIAGETGSGKSVLLHQIIISLLLNHTSENLQLYMVDPKRTELSLYSSLRNVKMVYDASSAIEMLKNICVEMDRRYKMISKSGFRDIESYNANSHKQLSRKVVIIDELADLMMKGYKQQTEQYIVRIAQLARACGIHLIIATQRPDRNIVTGLIKANIPTRICLSVSSGVNSNIILDRKDGKELSGKGDLLLLNEGSLTRCQAGYTNEQEIRNIVTIMRGRR